LEATNSIEVLFFGAKEINFFCRLFQNFLQNFIWTIKCSSTDDVWYNLILSLAREPDKPNFACLTAIIDESLVARAVTLRSSLYDKGWLPVLRLPIMIDVELGDSVRGQVHLRTLWNVKLEHVSLLKSDGGLDKLATVNLHIDFVNKLGDDFLAAHIG
jgi:hypothetical protein